MSISQINKLFQNKGCNIAVSVILGISVISMLGVGSRGCGNANPGQQQGDPNAGMIVVTAGQYEITKEIIDQVTQRQLEQFGSMDLPATFKIRMEGGAVDSQINNGLALILAKQRGVDFSDANLKKRIVEAETEAIRGQLEGNGKLRPGASEQELEDAFKKTTGQSYIDAIKNLQKDIDEKLANEAERVKIDASMAVMLLTDQAKSKFIPTEESVRSQFDTFHVKRIDITAADAGPEGVPAKAKKIHDEIKAGLSFEAAMDKYVSAKPPKGKKKSDVVQDMHRDAIENTPEIKGILTMKPGEVSDVIQGPGGSVIYKFVKMTSDVPKDFDKQKKTLMENKARNDAAKSIKTEVEKLDTPANVKWKNEGYKLLHQYLAMESAVATSPEERLKRVKGLIESALKLKDDPLGGSIASAVALTALNEAASTLPVAETDKLRIPVLAAYVMHYPELDVKIELAEAYIRAGDADNTAAILRDASEQNSIRTDEQGKGTWVKLNMDIKLAREKKLITVELATELNKFYTDWEKSYAEQLATQKKLDEEAKKRDDELKKAGQPNDTTKPPANGAEPKKPIDKQPSGTPKKTEKDKKPVGKP